MSLNETATITTVVIAITNTSIITATSITTSTKTTPSTTTTTTIKLHYRGMSETRRKLLEDHLQLLQQLQQEEPENKC